MSNALESVVSIPIYCWMSQRTPLNTLATSMLTTSTVYGVGWETIVASCKKCMSLLPSLLCTTPCIIIHPFISFIVSCLFVRFRSVRSRLVVTMSSSHTYIRTGTCRCFAIHIQLYITIYIYICSIYGNIPIHDVTVKHNLF
ncbi:Uncharacterized protein APZ42_013237 [Daphnia magna]|uniref:Uncharacterized protein n=1 Tax=Daphnia magna TaxID=35525 RepID=A0A0N7ZKP3_9CRUS|nr:Uncharacterized protein APZ42_013237 [Daphnia magna]